MRKIVVALITGLMIVVVIGVLTLIALGDTARIGVVVEGYSQTQLRELVTGDTDIELVVWGQSQLTTINGTYFKYEVMEFLSNGQEKLEIFLDDVGVEYEIWGK